MALVEAWVRHGRCVALACVALLLVPCVAFAAASTVHLRNGGLVRGELMEVQPNVVVRVRMADGTVREISWNDVASIEDGPSVTAPPATGNAALPPEPSANRAEINALLRERAEISDTGPAVMMIVGGGAFLLFVPIGAGLFALDAACSSDTTANCTGGGLKGPATVVTLIGVAGGVIGIWGLVKGISNGNRREAIDLQIRQLQQQRSLALDVVPMSSGGGFALSGRF